MKNYLKRSLSFLLSATMLLSVPVFAEQKEQSTLTVHFIDVGQGLSVLAQTDDETLLYDGGDRDTSSYLVSYLEKNGVEDIDYMISSHYDSDHLSGLLGVLNVFGIKSIIGSNYVHNSGLYESFISTAADLGKEIEYPEVGDSYDFGGGSFTVLAPTEITDDSNENSVAIRLDFGETSFIITGDAESGSEADMINSGINLDCDVLVAGHHGSATSSSWDFVEATLPEYVVISCGQDNQYGHPDEDTLEKFESIEAQIFRTDEQGNIIAVSDGKTITWSTLPSNTYTMYSTTSLNVREQPNTACAVIGKLNRGDTVEAAEDNNGWTTILYNNAIAYVASDYLSETVPAEETQPVTQPVTQPPATEAPTLAPQTEAPAQPVGLMVWLSATGSKYHRINNCGNMNPAKARQVTESEAIAQGYGRCKKCW